MIPRAMPWARSFCPFRAYGTNLAYSLALAYGTNLAYSLALAYGADLALFFSDGNGTDFLAEQEEDLVYFVESQCFLSLFQFSYESEAYARFRRQIYLGQSELLAHLLDV